MTELRSSMRIEDLRGDMTLFSHALATTPASMQRRGDWGTITNILAPSTGPMIVGDKARAWYVLPCGLKTAPLTGRTLERAQREGRPAIGVQRSAAHVETASLVLIDLDGVTGDCFAEGGRTLKREGVAFVAWTSYSIGVKPGFRGRVAIPVDRRLAASEYARAHAGLNKILFGGQADPTSARLSQQQGTWAVHPDRKHLARRWVVSGGVASADALMAAAPSAAAPLRTAGPIAAPERPAHIPQFVAALDLLDPNTYDDWQRGVSLGVAIASGPHADRDAIKAAVMAWESTAQADKQTGNHDAQYSTGLRFDTWKPSISADTATATLYATARDRALMLCHRAASTGDWACATGAWKYLAAYHRRQWDAFWANMKEPV